MTNEEQIAALQDEIKNLKAGIEAERKNTADANVALANAEAKISEQDAEIENLNALIEEIASADPAPAASAATGALEFKYNDELYVLNENPDREIILPGFGAITAAAAIQDETIIAYLVEKEIAEKL